MGMKNMTKEAFEQEILHHLREQQQRRPEIRRQDAVKFVFQAMLGVGHLLSSRDAAEEYITRETEQLAAASAEAEPLYEQLSPAWCRLNLREAQRECIPPAVIAGLMFSSGNAPQLTREDVLGFCMRHALPGEGTGETDRITDETWLPSHSAEYRERYHPAYRVISAEWIPWMEAIRKIAASRAERTLVTLDGPCASGKSTMAERLAAVFGAAVVHTDEFVIPHAQKTPERLAVPGGNSDSERLEREVIAPWKRSGRAVFRRYDCKNDRMLAEEQLPACRVLILEGSYCNVPVIRRYADVRIFLDAGWKTREERLRKRESAQSLQMFRDRWIPLEDRYFEAFGLPDPDCIRILPE